MKPPDPPELLEAERLVTRPLRVRQGWIIAERRDGAWIDHPHVYYDKARACVRKLRAETAVSLALERRGLTPEDWPDAIPWAGELAEKERANWKKAARHVIDCLPKIDE